LEDSKKLAGSITKEALLLLSSLNGKSKFLENLIKKLLIRNY